MIHATSSDGRHADPHHRPPAGVAVVHSRVDEREGERREHEARGVAALQHARHFAAQPRGPRFERERHARGPRAAHADAEERAADEEHGIGAGESAEERERRIPQNRRHQRDLAAPAIGERCPTRCRRSCGTSASRCRAQPASALFTVKLRWMSTSRNVRMVKSNTVEHPAEIGREEGLPLVGGDVAPPGPGVSIGGPS